MKLWAKCTTYAMKKYAPTPATAMSVVSSSPSSPGISRLTTNGVGGLSNRASGRTTQRYSGRPITNRGLTQRVLAMRVEPGRGSRPRRRYAVTTPTITATVTAKPNSACPTMCCDLVERAPEDVAEDAEERGPRAAPDDAVRDEAPVREPGRPGDERRQRADEPDEAADQDRLAAVPVEVPLHLLEPLVRDLHARAVLLEEARGRAGGRCRSSWCRRAPRRSRRSPISGSSSISPWPAITPPAITIVSPGRDQAHERAGLEERGQRRPPRTSTARAPWPRPR